MAITNPNDMAIDKNAFYAKYAQVAIEQQIKYGIPASITLAQMGFESTFGTSRLARESSNFFGVKQGGSWKGPVSYHVDDHGYPEAFRVYSGVSASVEDHSKVLLLDRYQKYCASKSSQDYRGWINGIVKGGYASSPTYKEDLLDEIQRYHLDRYDQMAVLQAQKQGVNIGYARKGEQSLPRMPTTLSLPIDFRNLKVTGMFHEDRGNHLHGGIDIATGGKNLPVYATENQGKVISACYGKATGNMIKIAYDKDDGTQLQCIYMHLSQINVKEGQVVRVAGPTDQSLTAESLDTGDPRRAGLPRPVRGRTLTWWGEQCAMGDGAPERGRHRPWPISHPPPLWNPPVASRPCSNVSPPCSAGSRKTVRSCSASSIPPTTAISSTRTRWRSSRAPSRCPTCRCGT